MTVGEQLFRFALLNRHIAGSSHFYRQLFGYHGVKPKKIKEHWKLKKINKKKYELIIDSLDIFKTP